MLTFAGARPFGQAVPQRLTAPKRAASVKCKAKAKAKAEASSRARGRTEDENQEGAGDSEGNEDGSIKSKTRKTNPDLAAKLQKLEVQKSLMLTQEKWHDRIKVLNREVTASLNAAAAFPQTKGSPDEGKSMCDSFLFDSVYH